MKSHLLKYAILPCILTLCGHFTAHADDLIAQCGFNDASGINSDATPGSPYGDGGTVIGAGTGESGWTATWTGWTGDHHFTAQGTNVKEGDLALRIFNDHSAWNYSVMREYVDQTNAFFVDMYISVGKLNGDNLVIYTGPDSFNAVQVAGSIALTPGGAIIANDGDGAGGWEDTGLTWSTSGWTRVTLHIDVASQVYRLWINGDEYAAPDPLGFRHACPFVDDVRFLLNHGDTMDQEVFVDSIRVLRDNPLMPLVISSFHSNGFLTWSHAATSGFHSVEWASSLTGAWHHSWADLVNHAATGGATTVAVPMFYRVIWTTNQVTR